MQAVVLPARAGYLWAKQGWLIFRSQPMAFFSWAMFVSLLLMTASITPPVGPLVFVVLMPAVTFMTISACRQAASGQRMLLGMWFAPLKEKGLFKKFLAMGGLYVLICIILGMIAFFPFMDELSQSVQTATASNNLLPLLDAVRTPMIIFEIKNYDAVNKGLGPDRAVTLVEDLARQVKAKLRRKTDIAMWGTRHILAMLPDTDKNGALATMERLKPVFDDYQSREKLGIDLNIASAVLSFPQDVDTKEKYLKKIPL